jgi:hypothetical protein
MGPVGLLADEPDRAWLELLREALEPLDAPVEIAPPEVGRPLRRPVRRVGEADPVGEHVELIGRVDKARREARRVEEPPEVVARVGEMGPLRVRVEAGVDAAEDDVEIRCEHVRDSALRDGRHGGAP